MDELFWTISRLRIEFNLNSNRLLAQPDNISDELPMVRDKLNPDSINVVYNLYFTGEMTIGEMARRETIARQTMSQIVAKLVRLGYVKRYNKDGNYRSVYIDLTNEGRSKLETHERIKSEYLYEKFREVATNEQLEKMRAAYAFLNEMVLKLEKDK